MSGEPKPKYASEIDEYNKEEKDFPQGEITELDSKGDPVIQRRKTATKKRWNPP